MRRLPPLKVRLIRENHLKGVLTQAHVAELLEISIDTVKKHVREFKEILKRYPNVKNSLEFVLPKPQQSRPLSERYQRVIENLPKLVDQYEGPRINSRKLFQQHCTEYPDYRYNEHYFKKVFNSWRKQNKICWYYHRRVRYISPEDQETFRQWRQSQNLSKWKRAVVITGSYEGVPLNDQVKQVEVTLQTLHEWIDRYKTKGIRKLLVDSDDNYVAKSSILKKEKKEKLMRLLHESPQLHGFNRPTWQLVDLAKAFTQLYGIPMGESTAQAYVKESGFVFKRAKEVLTSPDPKFREKLNHIRGILQQLGPREKFFSVDEDGPKSVKKNNGRALAQKDTIRLVEKIDKSRGWFILTAALELSTNQVTHFYSLKKDTEEMIGLIHKLVKQYRDQEKLYICWDSAGWHTSKKLLAEVAVLNSKAYREKYGNPEIELAPLPTSAQFLNVIESVFSGMARSVIHNSNYPTLEACKQAIDEYFESRNRHYQQNPKRAGNKIWGKEVVPAIFNDSNNCKRSSDK
jgi:transposase